MMAGFFMAKPVDREAATASIHSQAAERPRPKRGLVMVFDGSGIAHRPVPVNGTLRIGRGADADVVLDDPATSRLHASISSSSPSSGLEIADAGSAHGVFVNGMRLQAPRALRGGDVVRLGKTLFVAVDDIEAQEPLAWEIDGRVELVGTAAARRALDLAQRFAGTALSILLLGETGTGKDVLARAVHAASRRDGPLVAVNCAALPKELAESQLFGHKKGAFSGATDHHRGYFVAAHGGSLFLDEVGDLSLEVQAKLLRVIETMEVMPVGAVDTVRVDVRLVAATCQDLQKQVELGRFRQDLYHRLRGVALWMPPLRERNEEIPPLVKHFLTEGSVDVDALETLLLHTWPGNVRELRQVLQAASVRAQARSITRADLELAAAEPAAARAPNVDEVVAALVRHNGNVSRAARDLGAHRAQIYRILEEHGLRSEQFRAS
jgi:transcriptional regulator with GAF, ATPase, and Fis domain